MRLPKSDNCQKLKSRNLPLITRMTLIGTRAVAEACANHHDLTPLVIRPGVALLVNDLALL